MKPLEAKRLSVDLWTWLAETGEDKEDWPRHSEIDKLENWCPLCEIFLPSILSNCDESDCPLAFDNNDAGGCTGGLFSKWQVTSNRVTRKKLAGRILTLIKAWEPE